MDDKFKLINLQSGNFTAAGNFLGYTAKGERHFIPKRQMASLGFNTDEDLISKFPLTVVSTVKHFEQSRDKDGNLVDKPFDRDTVTATFSDEDQAIDALIADDLLMTKAVARIEQKKKELFTSTGITEKQLSALTANPVI